MRFAGSESWRLEVSVDVLPHVALYVRDAYRLPVADNPHVPPRLADDIADLSGQIDEAARGEAAVDWTDWWRSVIGRAGPPDVTAPTGGARAYARARLLQQVFDPPDWNSLADLPVLREIVIGASQEAARFADRIRRSIRRPGAPPSVFPRDIVRRAVEHTGALPGVQLSKLDASVSVLFVTGSWWILPRRGELLCSADTARNPDQGYEALVAVFQSLI